jgi:hypothetical protein
MLGRILTGGAEVALYGVVPPWRNSVRIFLAVLFLFLIPVVLAVGVLAFAKNKQFPKKERALMVAVVLFVYFLILVGAVFAVIYIGR